MKFFAILISSIIFSCINSVDVFSEVIVHDMIAIRGEEVMLKVETKGKLLSRGGEIVEFIVDGKSFGKSLSGGDGFAFKEFKPLKVGRYQVTAKSGKEEGRGLLLSLRKGDRIIFVDVEGSLLEGMFSERPKKGSQETITNLSSKFPIIFLQTGMLNTRDIKVWLKQNGFKESPVLQWNQGMIFDEIKGKGLKIKAVIGSPSVIQSAKAFKPKAYSFEEVENAEEVKEWEEIGKKLK